MSSPEILKDAETGKVKFFLQFGGQGGAYLKELQELIKIDFLKGYFDAAAESFAQCMDDPDVKKDSWILPQGIDFKSWALNPESAPGISYTSSAAISLPLIGVTQLGHYYRLLKSGFPIDQLIRHSIGATGHSQGVVSASLFALGLEHDKNYEHTSRFIKFLFYTSFRGQQITPVENQMEELIKESKELGDRDLSPMAAVLNCQLERLEKFISQFNNEKKDNEKVYISLYNTPDSNVISAYPYSMLNFRKKFKETMDNEGIKVVYVKTTCPFHSPLLEKAERNFAKDIEKIKFHYKGSDLKVPVFSILDGRNYQKLDKLGTTLFREMVIEALHWDKAIAVLNEDRATHCLDFGPGKVSMRLSHSWTKEKNLNWFGIALENDFQKLTGQTQPKSD
jgi:malonyl CoA-acyl carrier protein transacylase